MKIFGLIVMTRSAYRAELTSAHEFGELAERAHQRYAEMADQLAEVSGGLPYGSLTRLRRRRHLRLVAPGDEPA